jgi:hypothetical protein
MKETHERTNLRDAGDGKDNMNEKLVDNPIYWKRQFTNGTW